MENKETAVMLIGFFPNPRLYKRISVEKEIYNLHLICWDRKIAMQSFPKEDGYIVHAISIFAGNDPMKRIIPFIKFSNQVELLLKQINPDVIHVQGLDMLKIACKYKRKKNIRIIYEIADLHRLLIDKQKGIRYIAQKYLKYTEKKCSNEVDLLIVTSKKYVDCYFNQFYNSKKILYFPNVPVLSAFTNYKKKENKSFTVGFIGDIRYPHQMENLLIAAKHCDIRVLFAGFEQNGHRIEQLCKNYPKGEWFGRFDFETQVAELYGRCDAIYSVYDADMQNVRVALPNKLYEAVYCELPIIVAKNTYLAELVEAWNVGIAVDYKRADDLIVTINRLKNDKEYYQQFVIGCQLHKTNINLENYNNQLIKILTAWNKTT